MHLTERETLASSRRNPPAADTVAALVARDPPGAAQSVAGQPQAPRGPVGFAVWRLGFRPFYLLAGVFAAASIALWGAQYAGWLTAP